MRVGYFDVFLKYSIKSQDFYIKRYIGDRHGSTHPKRGFFKDPGILVC
jgi:hypothetical protein